MTLRDKFSRFREAVFGGSARHVLDEFVHRFPTRCPICSFHRYGISHGHVDPTEPVPKHEGCPEQHK